MAVAVYTKLETFFVLFQGLSAKVFHQNMFYSYLNYI